MSLSLNEVESTAKKAARGAGYPWGLAEEAAKATLEANDIDLAKTTIKATEEGSGTTFTSNA